MWTPINHVALTKYDIFESSVCIIALLNLSLRLALAKVDAYDLSTGLAVLWPDLTTPRYGLAGAVSGGLVVFAGG